MARISGEVFIIIGIIVAITSFFVKAIFFFVYVGAGFIIWGGIKLLYTKLAGEEKPKKQHAQHKSHHRLCPYCNRQVKPHDNFCSNCGALLKHQRRNVNLNQASHNQYHNRDHHQIRRVP